MANTRAPHLPIRVVLACQDRAYAHSLADILDAHGMEVLQSEQVDAQTLARADVYLTEIQNLRAEERQLLARIRAVAPLMEVVAISAEPVTQNAVRALRTGVFSVLPYPVSAEHLVSAVRAACSRKRRAEARMKQLNGGFRQRSSEDRSTPSTEERS